MTNRIGLVCVVVLSAIAATVPIAAARAQAPALQFTELAEDTTVTTASGATFAASKGWHLAKPRGLIVIQEPQRELAAAFVELSAATVEEAIAQAWKRWKPDFARKIRVTAKPPATAGWDEIAQTAYETAADERLVVTAVARRKGPTYYVTLVEGTRAAAERRGAQLNTAILGLRVAGRARRAASSVCAVLPARFSSEWKAAAGEHTDMSGVHRLILTGPPFVGLTFWLQTNEGRPALLFETAQQKYWFERPR